MGHPDAVQLRARRNPRLLALGILLACLGGLGAALLWQETAHSVTVVVMARKVTAGQRITGSDITTTTIGSAPGIASVPAAEMSELVGKSALFDLAPGALLAPGQIGDLVLPVNDTEVGLKLDRGRAPGAGVSRGTRVQLVPVSSSPADAVPAGDPVEAIVASDPQVNDTGDSVLLDVDVTPSDATRVAQLAARQQLAVVLEGQK